MMAFDAFGFEFCQMNAATITHIIDADDSLFLACGYRLPTIRLSSLIGRAHSAVTVNFRLRVWP